MADCTLYCVGRALHFTNRILGTYLAGRFGRPPERRHQGDQQQTPAPSPFPNVECGDVDCWRESTMYTSGPT